MGNATERRSCFSVLFAALIAFASGVSAAPTVRGTPPSPAPAAPPPFRFSGPALPAAPPRRAAPEAALPSVGPALAVPAAAAAPDGAPPTALDGPQLQGLGPGSEAPRSLVPQDVSDGVAAVRSALDAGDAEGARDAGIAAFDAAGRTRDAETRIAVEAPAVQAGALEGGRASGLSPPTDSEIVDAYLAARPGSHAVDAFAPQFVKAALGSLSLYTFSTGDFVEDIQGRMLLHDPFARARAVAILDIVGVHDDDAPPSRRFTELLGRAYAHLNWSQDELVIQEGRHLPPNPLGGGEYWDMASGLNSGRYIRHELEPGTRYTFFDRSPFAASYLRTVAALAGASNAAVVEADLLSLSKPERPLAVLRTKNAISYVPGFARKLEEMAEWIAPGGQLVVQTDPNPYQRGSVVAEHGPLLRRLIAAGWRFEFGFAGGSGAFAGYEFDTLALTRPIAPAPRPEQEVDAAWSAYVDAVRYADRRLGGGFLGLFSSLMGGWR